MKTIKKNVYYCDFCKKRNLSASHMHKHEKGCTNNPNRVCGICGRTESLSDVVDFYKSRFEIVNVTDNIFSTEKIEWIGKEITLDDIRDHVDGCPACMLSILRKTNMTWELFGFNFDFEKERKEWWNDVNIEYRRNEEYY